MKLSLIQSWVTVIKDVLTGLATLVVPYTAWIAKQGLTTWKRQLNGNADLELTRIVLKAVYNLREAFNIVWNPLTMAGEMAFALKEAGIEESNPD